MKRKITSFHNQYLNQSRLTFAFFSFPSGSFFPQASTEENSSTAQNKIHCFTLQVFIICAVILLACYPPVKINQIRLVLRLVKNWQTSFYEKELQKKGFSPFKEQSQEKNRMQPHVLHLKNVTPTIEWHNPKSWRLLLKVVSAQTHISRKFL